MSEPLAGRVAGMRWYHTLELPGGVETPGEYDLRPIVGTLPWPASLEGMRCLDVGSRDGFYAFEMERRGASEVLSLDLDDPAGVDHPHPRPPQESVRLELADGRRAFETAREALGSSVERRHLSVYELAPEAIGEFDFAVVGTLLLHLRDPVAALAAIRSVLGGSLLVNEVVLPGLTGRLRRPVAEMIMRDGPFWRVPNRAGLRRMTEAAGFEVRSAGGTYLVPYGRGYRRPSIGECLRGPLAELPRRLTLRRGAPHAWLLAGPASAGDADAPASPPPSSPRESR